MSSAFHEAGHAVMAVLCGATVECADAIRRPGQAGHCTYKIRRDPRRSLCIGLSGGVAEWLSRNGQGQEFDASCACDLTEADLDLAKLHGGNVRRESSREYRAALALTKRLLCEHWGAVKAVAQRLLSHGTVSGRFIHAVVACHRADIKGELQNA